MKFMPQKPTYTLDDLIARCDPHAPMPAELVEWEQAKSIGLEQSVIAGQADIREAVLEFGEKMSEHHEFSQLVLFGSRARGDYRAESDADLAVFMHGESGDFLETKLKMTDFAFDVLLETGVLIQALPIWETEWRHPERYSNPTILLNIAREGILIWRS